MNDVTQSTSNSSRPDFAPSTVPDAEPVYVNKGRFDANAAAWLLYGDYVFFQQHEIAWDGATHRIVGLQVNAAKMSEIPTLVANTNLLNGLADLLTELEKDEGLRVPLAMIHPGLHEALRNEDLTGITLFNLMACAQALIVKEPSSDEYQVLCDVRLPLGIPSFYQLVARMIWDMRVYNERSGQYKVTFANARNIDADVILGEVDQMVPGAFSQPMWQVQVTKKPQVELPSMEEAQAFAREASRVFASGFDDPMDIQADEELFVATLNQLAREFPITQDIEGTHHMGRIPRIEHVRVGDSLVLAADWQNEWFDPVCIEVFNAAGETLGNLRERFSPTLSGNRELACLLPHLKATVETVTPKSKRRKNAKYALMDVRMEIDPAVVGPDGKLLPEVIRDAKALLALPRGERVVVSKGGVTASQLKGHIKVDEAHDVANPAGKTFHLWEVELDDEAAVGSLPQTAAPTQPAAQPTAAPQSAPQQTFDTGRWTFDRHQRVQARRFSMEVPDQWAPGNDDSGRVLGQYESGIEDDSEYPQILCSSMAGDLDEETVETMRDACIPEFQVQMRRESLYNNDLANNNMTRVVNDWVVEAKNCQVVVFEARMVSLFPGMFPDSYEYHVNPIACDHGDFLRLTDSSGHLAEGELKALALAVAATVELDAPVELRRPAELERYCEGRADADAFCETVTVVAQMLNMSGSKRMIANLYRAVRQADNNMQVLAAGDTMPLIQAESFNECLYDEIHYFGLFVQALEKQAELGTDDFDRMWKLVGEFGDGRIVDHMVMSDDKENEAKVNALGVIKIPEGYAALRERWEALRPGPDGKPRRPVAPAAAAAVAAEPAMSKTAQRRAKRNNRKEAATKRKADEKAAAKRKAEEAQRRADEARRKANARDKRKAEEAKCKTDVGKDAQREAEATCNAEIEAARERLIRCENDMDELESRLSAILEEIDDIASRIEDVRASAPETVLEKARRELQTAQTELSSLGFFAFGKKRELKDAIAALKKTIGELENQTPSHYEDKIAELEKKREGADARSAETLKQMDSYEEEMDALLAIVLKPLLEKLEKLSIGDTIEFGVYPQSSAVAESEPIKWSVLDKREGKLLLLSDYVLDWMPFNKSGDHWNYYKSSYLSKWLSEGFEDAAFNDDERWMLVDSPFIMSVKELTSYLTTDAMRICGATEYARCKDKYRNNPTFYWLSDASTDGRSNKVYNVNPHGMILGDGRNVYCDGMSFGAIGIDVDQSIGVRPAIWVRTYLQKDSE